MRSSKFTGNAPELQTAALITLRKHLQLTLQPTLARLRGARSSIATAALALRHQNTDADIDIVHVMLRGAADPLDAEIERLEMIVNSVDGRAPAEPSPSLGSTH